MVLQDGNEPGNLILVASDGIQHPPLQFPSGAGMMQFLNCMESCVESNGGKFDPPLSSVEEEESAAR